MALYFFDTVDDGEAFPDECGTELVDIYEARRQALLLLADLAQDRSSAADRRGISVQVRCEDGRRCYGSTLSISGGWDKTYDLSATCSTPVCVGETISEERALIRHALGKAGLLSFKE